MSTTATVLNTIAGTIEEHQTIYGIALFQFFLGTLIVALNTLVLGATFLNRKLRAGSFYFLSSNLWFANVLLGGIVAVSNVIDKPETIALEKVEGTVAVMNCLATLATLLALSTARLVSVRTPQNRMANRTVLKILIGTWSGVFVLILIKALVHTLDKFGHDACYECLLGFEAALLMIFGFAVVVMFSMAMYSMCVRKKSAIHDSSAPVPAQPNNFAKEYHDTMTVGIWIGIFTVPFFILVILFIVHVSTIESNFVGLITAEVVISLFYLHCVINPLVFICRDDEIKQSAKRLITCQRLSTNQPVEAGPDPPPTYPQTRNPQTPSTTDTRNPLAPPVYSTLPPINDPESPRFGTVSNNNNKVTNSQMDQENGSVSHSRAASVKPGINNSFAKGDEHSVADPRGADDSGPRNESKLDTEFTERDFNANTINA